MGYYMEDIRDVYPGLKEPFYGPGNYYAMLESFGYEIVVSGDDKDYQGDSYILFRDGQQFGVLIFGWGSCSGCDALQACETYDELNSLRYSLLNDIKWGSAQATLNYFNEHDWEGDYSWHSKECREWVEASKKYLANY